MEEKGREQLLNIGEDISPEQIFEYERKHVMHSWSMQSRFAAPVVAGGAGCYFWDTRGRRYLDFGSQAVCSNLGHQHPRVVQAIVKQAETMCFNMASLGSVPRALLAKRLADIAPGDYPRTFFTTGGAEAVENAIKIARYFTGKHKIITRWRSYHGATAGAVTLTGDPRRWAAEPGIPGVVRAMDCYCYRCSFGLAHPTCSLRCVEHIGEIIQLEGPKTIAAVLIEPVVGSNGIIVPPDGYVQRLRDICTENDILLIADEVMTGFGRTGKWFACEHWNVQPDLIAIAKGLTSAYVPLGAVMVSGRVADYFENNMLFAGLTYSGHSLACAAGLGAIDALVEENIVENSRKLGLVLLERLERIKSKHPSVGDVRGLGLFAAVELIRDKQTREPYTPWNTSSPTVARMTKEAMDRGLFLNARWNQFQLSPPLVIDEEKLLFGLDVLDDVLAIADQEIGG